MSSSSKRNSMLPPIAKHGPKPPTKLSSTLTISDSAILTGHHSIIIMSESVIHPRTRLESTSGSLLIGKRCIVHERSHVGAAPEPSTPGASPTRDGGIVIGDYVTVEAAAVVEAGGTEVGEGSVIGMGSRIGAGAKIGKNCTITPKSVIAPGEEIPDFTVVFSNGMRRTDRRDLGDMRLRAQVRQIGVLKALIPTNLSKFQER
ncbi:uncharacterized protein DNG_07489 [Cephalotrichum gorgonifer]|uniref:Dynactin subunit 6 n=1 Tax=Cephalotrichum gorgonifer TaxID=2041049 RepID=A0AAE8N3F1_9PEZI|nr:uncharacterized protein DNG_07489 [Cephalotrichum gorgonifer]